MDQLTDAKKLSSSSKAVASIHGKANGLRRCGGGGGGGAVNSGERIPHDVVTEVLLRLPVKSLMRFKCVSKLWYSTISDSDFVLAHHSNSGALLITFTDKDDTSQTGQPVQRVLHVSPDKTLHHQASILLAQCNITQTINGLICLYINSDDLIFLCNISTHEIMMLPSPAYNTRHDKYYFGYDPIKDLYKLLKIHSEKDGDDYPCEILALGIDSSWRIAPPATLDLKSQSICINGVLYWGRDGHPNYTVVAFDLMKEEFRVNPIPRYMTETNKWNRLNVMELGGRLTLVQVEACLFDDGKLILWELDDDQVGELEFWTEHLVELPTELSEEGCRFPVGSLPTGELLLADYRLNSPMTVYSYDRAKGKFEKFLTAEFPSSLALVCKEAPRLLITYHKENLALLEHIIKGCSSLSSYVPLSDRERVAGV
ncbi:F-box At5g65850-like isoform X1 [Olea europaea subsp. europaea]|uniref:F-box At5g65850-like isoform X1 n=1 Tax=Olea europaea subsp. europaea TaxID=158383 RepID=A0A8S0VFX1_OLEEU|nr:F-box At5g65850-like isoform X1 [Olea europaea subsp. europaea]